MSGVIASVGTSYSRYPFIGSPLSDPNGPSPSSSPASVELATAAALARADAAGEALARAGATGAATASPVAATIVDSTAINARAQRRVVMFTFFSMESRDGRGAG